MDYLMHRPTSAHRADVDMFIIKIIQIQDIIT